MSITKDPGGSPVIRVLGNWPWERGPFLCRVIAFPRHFSASSEKQFRGETLGVEFELFYFSISALLRKGGSRTSESLRNVSFSFLFFGFCVASLHAL